MASHHYTEETARLKRPSLSAQMKSEIDRRRQNRADNVFTRIEDATYAVLRRHQKSA